jgi:hypothetical protein
MTTFINCDDCESAPCRCCEWCEMFPCECVDYQTGEAYDAETLDGQLAERVLNRESSDSTYAAPDEWKQRHGYQ